MKIGPGAPVQVASAQQGAAQERASAPAGKLDTQLRDKNPAGAAAR
jgi:hypothetical protein